MNQYLVNDQQLNVLFNIVKGAKVSSAADGAELLNNFSQFVNQVIMRNKYVAPVVKEPQEDTSQIKEEEPKEIEIKK